MTHAVHSYVRPSDVLGSDEDDFREFCEDIFSSLPRADQRRAGVTYLQGLLNCPGRKSIRRMVATAPGRSEQSLQQFVNQSPWDADSIRKKVMARLTRRLRPTAWVIEEVAFPKNGRYSAAVERQYVRALGKVSNCQMSIAVTLTTEQLSVPVNWRMLVPDSWGHDTERRSRARMPSQELPRPYWQYYVEVLDDMALDWGMPSAPIVIDTRHKSGAEGMLAALDLRGLPYLAQVNPTSTVGYPGNRPRAPRGGPVLSGMAPQTWRGSATELVRRLNPVRETAAWTEGDADVLRSQFLRLPVQPAARPGPMIRQQDPPSEHVLLVEWPLSKPRPRTFWISNMADQPLAELVRLAMLRHQVAPRIEDFATQFGLRDFEGRTFAGWHHHVTLANAAYVYQVLQSLRPDVGQAA